jgi:hypothetical protein
MIDPDTITDIGEARRVIRDLLDAVETLTRRFELRPNRWSLLGNS